MYLIEALKALHEGKRIRRKSWEPGVYLTRNPQANNLWAEWRGKKDRDIKNPYHEAKHDPYQ
jgi:hypothetical protein